MQASTEQIGAEHLLELRDMLGRTSAESVALSRLTVAGSPRSTVESPHYTRELAASEGPLPPILVHRATMTVIDGIHRFLAARLRGCTHIDARYFEGSEAQGRMLAVALNVQHGRPLSLEERVTAARQILTLHPHWADRPVAAIAGLSATKTSDIRRELFGDAARTGKRVGRDGRVRPLDPAQGRTLAAELLTRDPGASLRQIARQAGVSPTTVSDVRDRMARGQSPVLQEPSASGQAPRRRQPAPQPSGPAGPGSVPQLGDVLDTLRRDPSLRLNDTGRSVLRLLDVSAAFIRNRESIAASLPPHCVHAMARLAQGYAHSWALFAEQLGRDQGGP
ncbi:ParB N-terminal domain-containing protein [Streptomyces sp. NPDC091217]|uniref:ParB N-terminal domain-containing protein n=1 Tax=Streptomyces sp. NPDC091217 TaxID=3365975 RepID=UPI0038198DF4